MKIKINPPPKTFIKSNSKYRYTSNPYLLWGRRIADDMVWRIRPSEYISMLRSVKHKCFTEYAERNNLDSDNLLYGEELNAILEGLDNVTPIYDEDLNMFSLEIKCSEEKGLLG